MKKNQFFAATLFSAFALFHFGSLSAQTTAMWSYNETTKYLWTTNPNANVGIGTSSPWAAKLQFANGEGNKIVMSDFYNEAYNYGFNGFGVGAGNNLCAFIPDEPGQRFSLRLNSSSGPEKFMVVRDGSVGIGGAYPSMAKMQFDNSLGNKITFFDDGSNTSFGFGMSPNNLVAYIPNKPGYKFSIRHNNFEGAEKFAVNADGTVAAGRRIFVGMTGTESGLLPGYSLLHFKNGNNTKGGIIRASQGTSDLGNAPLVLESGSLFIRTGSADRIFVSTTGNVGIGTNNPTFKLAVNGTIRAKEVRVETGWADFVFEPDYTLRPLTEVETYIRQHKHLPDVASAAEIRKDGLQVGEQMTQMMRKIEELTLYVIDLKKENTKMQQENADLKTRLEKLEK